MSLTYCRSMVLGNGLAYEGPLFPALFATRHQRVYPRPDNVAVRFQPAAFPDIFPELFQLRFHAWIPAKGVQVNLGSPGGCPDQPHIAKTKTDAEHDRGHRLHEEGGVRCMSGPGAALREILFPADALNPNGNPCVSLRHATESTGRLLGRE